MTRSLSQKRTPPLLQLQMSLSQLVYVVELMLAVCVIKETRAVDDEEEKRVKEFVDRGCGVITAQTSLNVVSFSPSNTTAASDLRLQS